MFNHIIDSIVILYKRLLPAILDLMNNIGNHFSLDRMT